MACTLSNKCAKNLSKWTVLLQLIIKNVVTCFFWNTVYRPTLPEERVSFYELIDTDHTTQKTELINKTIVVWLKPALLFVCCIKTLY